MIYLHVPFCRSFCSYCDFYSEICSRREERKAFNDYPDAVEAEIEERKEELLMNMRSSPAVRTLYIGGGTPSALPLDVLSRVASSLRPFGPFSEFTVEVNPEDIVEKGSAYVTGLLGLGVNRISMGVQSFDDSILNWMNRRHDSARAKKAFEIIRKAGNVSVSVDLIFGLSQLSDEVWNDTLSQALSLGVEEGFNGPDHISAYQLSIEKGSALAEMMADGRYKEASEEQCRGQYDILCDRLREAGFHHYEISNFAKPGFEAVHNSAYWHRIPYVGLGPGAHSFTISYDGVKKDCDSAILHSDTETRSWNSQTLPVRGEDGKMATYSRSFETLSAEDIRVERIMLPLRTDTGLPENELRSLADHSTVDRLIDEGALVPIGGNLRIPESRFFTSDEIIRELI